MSFKSQTYHGLKNVNILTYDELATRLNNYIEVLNNSVRIRSCNSPLGILQ